MTVTTTGKPPAVPSSPATLQQAHELLHREWPGNDVSPVAWLAYHRHAAEVYAYVAEVDADHHHEALCWANQAAAEVQAGDWELRHRQSVSGSGGAP